MIDEDRTKDQVLNELELYEKILGTSSLGVAIFSTDGTCILMNEKMRSILRGALEQDSEQDLLQSEMWAKADLLDGANEVLSTGIEKRKDVHIKAFETEAWLDSRLSRIVTDGENRLVLIVNDITQHKRAEEGLRQSEEMLRGILAVSPVGIGLTQKRKIKWVNEAWTRMFGFESEYDWANQSARIVYSSQKEYERVGRLLYGDVNPGEGAETDAKFRRKDGTTFDGYVRIKALDPSDPEKGAITVMYDITDRRKAEQALRESEERFRTIFEATEDCIFIKDRNLRYTYVNPAMEKFLGREASEILGTRAENFFGEEAGKIIRDGDRRVLRGQSIEIEHTRLLKGNSRTVHEVKVPLKNLTGEIVGICGISREITERKNVRPNGASPAPEHYPSAAMQATLREARYAAATDSIVLLLGESGSGKDYLARWIHDHSRRSSGPYFSVNCAAISKELAESELFGHEAGAFTGATGRKRGLLELAEGGTLLLNEIGELSLSLQSKLLTFLDTKSFLRVGGDTSIHINARLIAATHRNLELEVAEGRFLSALFYRLNVFAIDVPPLRYRIEDIPMLVEEIMSALGSELQLTQAQVLNLADINTLMRYSWPGNVRELRNVLERAMMLPSGDRLNLMLPTQYERSDQWAHNVQFAPGQSLNEIVREITQSLCEYALRRSGGSKKDAARLLNISRGALYRYLKGFATARDYETHD
jgi:PAS domain S-box-containing protein